MDKIYDVYGIGNPLIDILKVVNYEFLNSLGVNKGAMNLIEHGRREELLAKITDPTISLGGSCANTIIAMASLGSKSVYGGGIGNDPFGDQFDQNIKDYNVRSALKRKSLPTGSSIIFITEDADRTQNTYLGACQQYSIPDVEDEIIAKTSNLYFTGYMWDTPSQKEALKHAIDVAKDKDTKIIFDVADPFAVNRSKDDFVEILKNHVDFVFTNFDEGKSLTGESSIDGVIEAMRNLSDQGVVKDGSRGSYIFDQSSRKYIPVHKVNAMDTTGAGDMYAAGFLFGMTQGYELEKSGKIASFVAAKVVEQVGARLDGSLKDIITNQKLV